MSFESRIPAPEAIEYARSQIPETSKLMSCEDLVLKGLGILAGRGPEYVTFRALNEKEADMFEPLMAALQTKGYTVARSQYEFDVAAGPFDIAKPNVRLSTDMICGWTADIVTKVFNERPKPAPVPKFEWGPQAVDAPVLKIRGENVKSEINGHLYRFDIPHGHLLDGFKIDLNPENIKKVVLTEIIDGGLDITDMCVYNGPSFSVTFGAFPLFLFGSFGIVVETQGLSGLHETSAGITVTTLTDVGLGKMYCAPNLRLVSIGDTEYRIENEKLVKV